MISLNLLTCKYLSTYIQIIVSAKSLLFFSFFLFFLFSLLIFWLYSLGIPQELPRENLFLKPDFQSQFYGTLKIIKSILINDIICGMIGMRTSTYSLGNSCGMPREYNQKVNNNNNNKENKNF